MKLFSHFKFFLIGICACTSISTAQTSLDSLKAIWSDESINDSLRCDALFNYAWDGYLFSQPDSAEFYANKELTLALKSDLKIYQGDANHLIGSSYYIRGNYPKALKYYYKGLKIREEINYTRGIGASLNNIAMIYAVQGDTASALKNYLYGLEIDRKLNDSISLAHTLNNIANLYRQQNKIDEAQRLHEQALEIRKLKNDLGGISASYGNLGNIQFDKKNFNKALELYEKAYKIDLGLNDEISRATNLSSISSALHALGRTIEGIQKGEEALKIAQKFNELNLTRDISRNLFEMQRSIGAYKKSLDMLELYSNIKDTIFNEENAQARIDLEYKYKYEKKATADSVKHAEHNKVIEAESKANEAEAIKHKLQSENHQLEVEKQKEHKLLLFGGLGLAILLAIFVFSRLRITRKQKSIIEYQKTEVEAQKKQIEIQHGHLEEIHKEISDSIAYAERLQLAILPSRDELKTALGKGFVLFKPKDVVSGDFYWMQKVEDTVFFAAADCTGHGVPGAMVSVVCSNALNRCVKEFDLKDPGKILDMTRELVIETFARSGKDVKDGMDIALCALTGDTLLFSGANNPLWIVRNKSMLEGDIIDNRSTEILNELALFELKANKQPIGLYEGMKPFETHLLKLEKEDAIYLFTDGYADQFGGPKGKKLKYKPFKRLLLANQHLNMEEQRTELNNAFMNWRGSFEQVDDVCIIGVKYS